MRKVIISRGKPTRIRHRINPDWEKRRDERDQRIMEREKHRDEMFEKLVTAATEVIEQMKAEQELKTQLESLPNYTAYRGQNLSKAARDIFDRIGFGYILRIRPKGEAVLIYPKSRIPRKPPLRAELKASYELIDSGLLRHVEVETRNYLTGLTELGIYSKGNFYCCLQ
jgi:hypothetical protein